MEILSVKSPEFKKYGRIIPVKVDALLEAMKETPVPDDVVYVPGDAKLEATVDAEVIKESLFGGMPVQIGYCNGHNTLLNAVEYHRNSEINVASTDIILILGMQQDIGDDFTYDTNKMEAFLVPEGTVIECYATTLHYAPCQVNEDGFRCVVVLPLDTNTDLNGAKRVTGEDRLLFAKNKWLIAHPESGLEKDGAFIGLKGPNLDVSR